MLPKNKSRKELMKKIKLIQGPYHNYHFTGLPQFVEPKPLDLNEFFNIDNLTADDAEIVYSSEGKPMEELSHLPYNPDPEFDVPEGAKLRTKSMRGDDIRKAIYYG